jgi:hypothetical protein
MGGLQCAVVYIITALGSWEKPLGEIIVFDSILFSSDNNNNNRGLCFAWLSVYCMSIHLLCCSVLYFPELLFIRRLAAVGIIML